jgi:outer membrane protein assembly factor BamB
MRRTLLVLCALAIVVSTLRADDWPQWRGPERTGRSAETGLLAEWPEDGPKVLWKLDDLGAAYSSVAVADGKVYTQGNVTDPDADTSEQSSPAEKPTGKGNKRRNAADADGNGGVGQVVCLDEKSGRLLWSASSPAEKKAYQHDRGDGSRGTPTVVGDRVYCIGGGGDLTCYRADSGEVVWSLHLVDDLGGSRVPGWGYSESPLIDGEKCVVTPGGKDGTIAALDKTTGKVLWRSTDVTDAAHYSSAIVAEVHGVRQYVQFTRDRVVGVDAATGKLLWDYDKSANRTANVATPICVGEFVFTSSAYGTGGGLVKLTKDGDEWAAEEIYFQKPLANHHGGVVYLDGYLYGFGSGGLLCLDFMTGEIAWRNRSVGKGSLCYADGRLYCFGEKNQMALVQADPKEYVELGRFETPDTGKPSWAHPVVANGRLYLRDQNLLTVYDVSAKSP